MTRRDPFTEIETLLERMGREFEALGSTLDTPELPGTRDLAVDVFEDDETVTVVADLPGFDEDEIEVELRDDALLIAATHETESEVSIGEDTDEGADADGEFDDTEDDADAATDDAASDPDGDVRYHRRERRTRAVSRRVPIPASVERDGASASYDVGVLTVTLPKRSATDATGHSIDVS
ncbi:heat shock protein Hsp20 [Halorubrum aidingense JCM 13560]|uniref:Heat shock protein Hsp20 n=1 Tax=Halorubrum aidingense JCM 13560 TaxID=1230454 RepID=M0P8M4_9EURY|nr:Hsp20/alpha crystallin family protein [Halorubrum aidingense]EMA65175.1 heat shock protein Hsp20 [Halorubrum aidingense JCM 13560]